MLRTIGRLWRGVHDARREQSVVRQIDQIFAAFGDYGRLRRIAGGYQTDVYGSDDGHYVVKLKNERGGKLPTMLKRARQQRAVAEQFVDALGAAYTVPSRYLIVGTTTDDAHMLVIQPFISHARALSHVRYHELDRAQRAAIALQLRHIMRRSLALLRRYGYMPDLNGLPSGTDADRRRLRTLYLFPLNVWRFATRQTLLRSNNVLLHFDPPVRVVLVDYDLIHHNPVVQRIYYSIRAAFFLRDWWLLRNMEDD